MSNINFVRHRRRELTKLEIQDRKYMKYAIGAFTFALTVTIGIMGTRLFLAYSNTQTLAAIDRLTGEIEAKQEIENEYLVFIEKARVITELFGQRREKQQALAYFSSLFDPSVVISQLSYDANSHQLAFTLRAPHVFSLQTVFDTLLSSNVKATYPTFSIDQISRSFDTSYSMQISLPLRGMTELDNADAAEELAPDAATTGTEEQPL